MAPWGGLAASFLPAAADRAGRKVEWVGGLSQLGNGAFQLPGWDESGVSSLSPHPPQAGAPEIMNALLPTPQGSQPEAVLPQPLMLYFTKSSVPH